ncbi:MAG: transcription antitermination factor NusB [Clostridia bacterium]
MSRRDARETVMKLIYQQMIHEVDVEDESTMMLAMFRDEKEKIKINERDQKYIRDVLAGVESEKGFLDEVIARLSLGWQLKRIPLVDLSILRLAIYEMKFREDIPVSVSINESVELAKRYCGEVSASAINGILGNFARKELSAERLK